MQFALETMLSLSEMYHNTFTNRKKYNFLCRRLIKKSDIHIKHAYTLFVNSRADDWQKVLSLRTLLVRSVQHLVTYTKMFVCMSSFRIRLMTSSLMSTNRVTALEPYIPIITDYQNFAYSWQISLHLFLISIHN